MNSWKTTLCGILVAVLSYVAGHLNEFPVWMSTVVNIGLPLATALGLGFAADASSNREAKSEVAPAPEKPASEK